PSGRNEGRVRNAAATTGREGPGSAGRGCFRSRPDSVSASARSRGVSGGAHSGRPGSPGRIGVSRGGGPGRHTGGGDEHGGGYGCGPDSRGTPRTPVPIPPFRRHAGRPVRRRRSAAGVPAVRVEVSRLGRGV